MDDFEAVILEKGTYFPVVPSLHSNFSLFQNGHCHLRMYLLPDLLQSTAFKLLQSKLVPAVCHTPRFQLALVNSGLENTRVVLETSVGDCRAKQRHC